MSKLIDLTGKRFGKLVVIKRTIAPNNAKEVYWECQCDCGNITNVRGTHLRQGKIVSCGCYGKSCNKKDLTGLRFGKLLVIKEVETETKGTSWLCKCDCGKEKVILGSSLRSGHTKSCGCLNIEQVSNLWKTRTIDLSNQRFGKLIALFPLEEHSSHGIVWHCICDCGSEYDVQSHLLKNGRVSSCGCLGRSRGEEKIRQILKENNIEFETEKYFSTCRSKKGALLRFDFYINNKYLIEFDGTQHSESGSGWNTPTHLKEVQERDLIKNRWTKENNIPLIRIPYQYLDKLNINDLKIETTNFLI